MSRTDTKVKVATRKDARYPQLSELSMTYEGFVEDAAVRAPDLSLHGMFINTRTEYPEGAVLKLRFRLVRTGILIETRGEVRYCLKGVGVGVEFVDISPDIRRAIEEEISLQTAGK